MFKKKYRKRSGEECYIILLLAYTVQLRITEGSRLIKIHMGNSSVTHVTFFQFFYFHQATIKHLVDQSNKFKAYDDLGVQFYITT